MNLESTANTLIVSTHACTHVNILFLLQKQTDACRRAGTVVHLKRQKKLEAHSNVFPIAVVYYTLH